MKIRLFYKLFGAFLVIGLLVVAIAGALLEKEVRSVLVGWTGDEMAAEVRIIALMPPEVIARDAAALAERTRARLTLIDPAGSVIADSDTGDAELESHLNRTELQEARMKGLGTAIRYSHTLKKEMIYVAVPLREGSRFTGYIRLARPIREVNVSIEALRRAVLDILLVIFTISLMIALLFVMRTISPIRILTAFTERVRTGNLAGRVRIESRDELGELAGNINEMVAALQEKIRAADEEKGKLQALFAGMAEGIMVLDTEDRIETLNRGMEEMIGFRSEEVIGRTLIEAFRNIPLHDALAHFRATGETVSREITLQDESPVFMDVTISAITGATLGEQKTLLVFHDVTRTKQLERIRTDFVANVTHEIKTPLTAIIGFVETLRQGALNDNTTALRFLRTIQENAQRLNRLVDDLLTLSGIEMGEIRLKQERQTLAEVLPGVLELVGATIAEKRLNLINDIPKELPAIRADWDRLIQILLNIVDNAIKFTPPGGTITISASPDAEGHLTIRIADTGVGIPKNEIPRLGERFYRTDRTRSRELGGTGLGLSIVKHLMKAHGGRMVIDSALGQGTTVSLSFPIFLELT